MIRSIGHDKLINFYVTLINRVHKCYFNWIEEKYKRKSRVNCVETFTCNFLKKKIYFKYNEEETYKIKNILTIQEILYFNLRKVFIKLNDLIQFITILYTRCNDKSNLSKISFSSIFSISFYFFYFFAVKTII